MEIKEIKKILRKGGFQESKSSMSSRVRGWCSHIGEGYELNFYPWKTSSSIKGRRINYYLSVRQQDCSISYYHKSKEIPENKIKEIYELLKQYNIVESFRDNKIIIKIDNPYSEQEINSEEERIKRIRKY